MHPGPGFAPLPAPRGAAPYRRHLSDVLGAGQIEAIRRDQALRFHAVGDTGGWRDGHPQDRVARAMVADLDGPGPADFFYHLGDVVYPHGEESHYGAQFFTPYREYRAPIFAVPGNHDGEAPADARSSSLEPFLRAFCSTSPPLHDAAVALPRPPAGQPHVHWTLVHDWVRIIGLYSNVHEDGEIADEQLDWLAGELRAAPAEATVIVAVHRPVYSVDVVHGSNLDLGDALDAVFRQARRLPDLVLSGHVHDYQRFTRRVGGRAIPYIVAGCGGFYERHAAGAGLPSIPASFAGLPEVTLDAYEDGAHGYLTVTVTPAGAEVAFTAVSAEGAGVRDAVAVRRGGSA